MMKPCRRQVTPLFVAAALFAALIGAAFAQTAPAAGDQPLINIDVKDAPVEQVLRMLAKAANVNILIGNDVKGTVEAVALRDVTVDAALRLIAKSQGFYWYKDDNVYVVSKQPPTPEQNAATAPPAVGTSTRNTEVPPTTTSTPPVPVPGAGSTVTLSAPPQPSGNSVGIPTDGNTAQPLITSRMIPLAYADAREIAVMFGGSVVGEAQGPGYFNTMGVPPSKRHASLSRGGKGLSSTSSNELFSNGFNTPTAGNGGALGWGQDFGGGNQGGNRGGRGTRGGDTGGNNQNGTGRQGGSSGRQGSTGGGGGALDAMLPGDMEPPVAFLPQNALLVAGTQEDIDKFREILDLLDKPSKQVEISAKFIEVQTTADTALGIDWSLSNGSLEFFNQGFAPGEAVNNVVRFARGRFEAQLNALISSGRATVINEPHVITMNNQFAEISFQTSIPYFQAIVSYDQNGNRSVDFEAEEIDVDNSLWVVPRINADDSVTCYLEPTLEDTVGEVEGPNGERIPIVTSQYVSTSVRVGDGETIVLGGLIRKDESSTLRETPLLSRIPIIGKLFQATRLNKRNSELLIFVTPRIIRDMPTQ